MVQKKKEKYTSIVPLPGGDEATKADIRRVVKVLETSDWPYVVSLADAMRMEFKKMQGILRHLGNRIVSDSKRTMHCEEEFVAVLLSSRLSPQERMKVRMEQHSLWNYGLRS